MSYKKFLLFFCFILSPVLPVFFLDLLPQNILSSNLEISSASLSQNEKFFFLTQNQSAENATSKKRPAPPQRIPPNRVKPGGGLDSSLQSCNQNGRSLTALVPLENPVLTTKAYPSFLFYIPDVSTDISYGEFSLFTADEKQRIYSTTVDFAKTPGIIKIDIPPKAKNSLQTESYYHWYLRIYCKNATNPQKSLDIDGWIKRVSLPLPKSQTEDITTDIWYDSIAQAAENITTSSENAVIRDRWLAFLEYLNLEHIADLPIIEISPSSERSNKPER
jgi:hypothetical protein